MLYLSKVAVGILRQSIHFLRLPRPVGRSLSLPRVPCLRHQNKPIIPRPRKPQQSLKKYDCLPRLLGDGHLALLGFERAWTSSQLLSTSTPSQTQALPLFLHFSMAAKSHTYLFRSSPLQRAERMFGSSRWPIIHVRAAVTAET